MLQPSPASLWSTLSVAGHSVAHSLLCADADIAFRSMVAGSALQGRSDALRGRSVLVVTTSQVAAALALIELDGLARRIVLCPPDFPLEHLSFVIKSAAVDAIVSDREASAFEASGVEHFISCSEKIVPSDSDRSAQHPTEWVLLTSGTTGLPKLVVHSLLSLTGAIAHGNAPVAPVVWSTFYDIRRYGGLQIFLRALLTGTSLVLSDTRESTADFLARAGSHGITHISGTPSHWRRALMSPSSHLIKPEYARLSGEIADQAILNHIRSVYPLARISHAFATTEAGVAFEVTDGLAGFPTKTIGHTPNVDMKIEDRSLRIRSARTASRYLGEQAPILKDAEGFVDTGDMVELREDRYYFIGRRDGVINVGGLKVYPEEVEAVINRHPRVEMSLVRTKKNPITGALVVADVVLKASPQSADHNASELQRDILLFCRDALSQHKVPAAINFVPALAIAGTGKLIRRDA